MLQICFPTFKLCLIVRKIWGGGDATRLRGGRHALEGGGGGTRAMVKFVQASDTGGGRQGDAICLHFH